MHVFSVHLIAVQVVSFFFSSSDILLFGYPAPRLPGCISDFKFSSRLIISSIFSYSLALQISNYPPLSSCHNPYPRECRRKLIFLYIMWDWTSQSISCDPLVMLLFKAGLDLPLLCGTFFNDHFALTKCGCYSPVLLTAVGQWRSLYLLNNPKYLTTYKVILMMAVNLRTLTHYPRLPRFQDLTKYNLQMIWFRFSTAILHIPRDKTLIPVAMATSWTLRASQVTTEVFTPS